MAYVVGSLVGEKGFLMDFFVGGALVAGQLIIRDPTAANVGEVISPTTTAALGAIGIAQNTATSDTTPATDPRYNLGGNIQLVAGSLENIVRAEVNPFAIYRFPISGGATAGTALQPATATPAHILINDTADAAAPFSLITDTGVGTVSMVGGLIKGRTGNNVGQIRKQSAHGANASATVGIGYVNAIAAGDTFIRVPYSRSIINMQLTTDFVEADGIIATGTGATMRIVAVHIDEQRDVAAVDVKAGDHFYGGVNALS